MWLATGVLVAVAVVTLGWFQPQKLLYDHRVDEGLPSAAADESERPTRGQVTAAAPGPGPVELASGSFISREHRTDGTARVLRLPDGRVIVRFEDFATSNGPVLVVWLSKEPAHGEVGGFDDDDHVDLGPLKGNVGDQNYVLPPGVDSTAYLSVVVWCDRFDVPFGAAGLTSST
jgi:hypothetical protein